MRLPAELYGLFDIVETPFTMGASTIIQVAKSDSSRVGIIFSCTSAAAGFSTVQDTVTTHGLQTTPSNPNIMLSHVDFGSLVCLEWFCKAGVGAVINVIEVFLRRKLDQEGVT